MATLRVPNEVACASLPIPTATLPGVLLQPWPMLWPLSDAQEALADPAPLSAAARAAAAAPPIRAALIVNFLMSFLLRSDAVQASRRPGHGDEITGVIQ